MNKAYPNTRPARAAIYARYSTDLQSAASIPDQVRLCRRLCEERGWTVVEVFADEAMSGASHLRPDFQRMQQAAMAGQFDVLVAESLDRLSRDQEHIAGLHKRMRFLGVDIVTKAEGAITEMHIGLGGTMSALFLRQLAEKTHRGLEGRIKAGKSAGGISYGYRLDRQLLPDGSYTTGDRVIAEALNLEGIPAPRGRHWSASTLHGNRERGTGILNNPLYAGVRVWNRLNYAKDPDTGKRVSRQNPEEIVERIDVPHLRIVDEALWEAARTRQGALKSTGTDVPIWDRRRPKYLFSGLMVCGCCGAGFSKVTKDSFGCSAARNKGAAVCTNMTVIKKDDIEGRVLHALEHHLMDDEAVRVFCEEYAAERNRLEKAADTFRATREAELRQVKRDHDKLVDALLEGIPAARVKSKMEALAARQAELEALLAASPAPSVVRFHPSMAGTYRKRIRE
ncbi:recombinase family protein, partial [Rhodobacter capsulatus]